jgi:hypothetical protein
VRVVVWLLASAALVTSCSAQPVSETLDVRPTPGTTDHTHTPGTAPHTHPWDATGAAPTPTAAPVPLRAGERAVTLRLPGGPYAPAAPSGGYDDYRCFLVDPQLAEDAFVTGSNVIPGNPAVVHHAILFAVAPQHVAAVERHDAATAGRGWTCFGDTAVPNDSDSPVGALDAAPWLAGWAPGGGETVTRGQTGRYLEAGSRIVLQLHYNLRAGDEPDDTAVRLRLMPGDADLEPLQTMLLVAPVELPCLPAESGSLCDRGQAVFDLMGRFGARAGRTVAGLQLLCGGDPARPQAGTTQQCDRTVPRDMRVHAVAGHMHLLGRSIRVSHRPAAGPARVLLDRPVWNFDDQGATPMRRPVPVRAGDTMRLSCTHDAALRSMLPELADEPPRYVTWGEGTSDEMCLGIVLYTVD